MSVRPAVRPTVWQDSKGMTSYAPGRSRGIASCEGDGLMRGLA